MREITAPHVFYPFEDVCVIQPFIERLSRELKDVACESCFKRDPNLKSCKSCLDIKYCGKACQKKDWKIHKLECQKLKNLPLDQGVGKADNIRLHGNTILKIKGKDWKTIKSNIVGIDVSFDDIDASDYTFPTHQRMYYNAKKEYIRRYIGEENMPNDEEFKQIFQKVDNSLYLKTFPEFSVATSIVLLELSLFATECIPNCHLINRKGMNIIKAVKKIEESEKLSLSRKSLFEIGDLPGVISQCNCTDCRLPYEESVLSNITDEQQALEVIIKTQQFISTWELFRDLLRMPDAEYQVDDLLEQHEGVLGDTNVLHLKLLAIKCFDVGGNLLEDRRCLLKLEKNLVAAFGEFHPHLLRVFDALSLNSFLLGNLIGSILYYEKATLLRKLFS